MHSSGFESLALRHNLLILLKLIPIFCPPWDHLGTKRSETPNRSDTYCAMPVASAEICQEAGKVSQHTTTLFLPILFPVVFRLCVPVANLENVSADRCKSLSVDEQPWSGGGY